MLKRVSLLLMCILTVILSIGLFTMCSDRASDEIQFVYDYDSTEGCYAITGTSACNGKALIIPSEYNDKPVKVIMGSAFKDCKGLTSVVIPDSIEVIGNNAFANCSGLKSVTIGSGVTYIGERAFASCEGLTRVSLPDSVEHLGSSAFLWCRNLKSITIGKGLTDIDTSVFGGCESLAEIRVSNENGVYKSIDGSLYSKDGKTLIRYVPGKTETRIVIPDGVTEISRSAFSNCGGYTEIKLPNSLTRIGEYGFYGCTGLTEIKLPDSLTGIGECGFYGCTGLTEITIPNSVEYIDKSAFKGCTELKSVNFGNGVTHIGDYAFADCAELTEITLPDSLTSIKTTAFYDCTKLADIKVSSGNAAYMSIDGNLYSKDGKTFVIYACGKTDEGFVLPDSVTEINLGVFYGAYNLKSLTLPFVGAKKNGEGDTYFGYIFGAYGYSDNAEYVPSGLQTVVVTGGNAIDAKAFYGCTGLTSVTISDSVTSIGLGAFEGCEGLTSLTLPFVGAEKDGESNTHFGYIFGTQKYENNAKYVPSSLQTVVLTGGSTIASEAFSNCTGLTSITIPDSVTSIGNSAFYGCADLASITIPNSVTSMGNSVFCGCTGLTSVTLSNNVTSIGYKAFYHCTGLTSITIPNGVTSMGDSVFYGCTGLASITIPNGVTSIGYRAFYYCTGITSITIPNSVTSIDSLAFSNCTGLTSFTIGDGLTDLYLSIFSDCGVNRITIPKNVENIYIPYDGASIEYIEVSSENVNYSSIDGNLYDKEGKKLIWCAGGTDFTIPEGVTKINNTAFYGCGNLKSVTLPSSVTEFDISVFFDCDSLKEIKVSEENEVYKSLDKGLYTKDGKTLLMYTERFCGTSFEISEGVTSIGERAFYGCTALTSVSIPEGVESIGKRAFYNCIGLTSVTLPNSLKSIGDSAFYACTSITKTYRTV